MYGIAILIGIIIGLQLGWWGRRIIDAIVPQSKPVEQAKQTETARPQAQSVIISDRGVYEKGKAITLPEYKPTAHSGIIRARKPKEVRREQAREFEKVYQDVAAEARNGRG